MSVNKMMLLHAENVWGETLEVKEKTLLRLRHLAISQSMILDYEQRVSQIVCQIIYKSLHRGHVNII